MTADEQRAAIEGYLQAYERLMAVAATILNDSDQPHTRFGNWPPRRKYLTQLLSIRGLHKPEIARLLKGIQ